jgi:hypothetical protein
VGFDAKPDGAIMKVLRLVLFVSFLFAQGAMAQTSSFAVKTSLEFLNNLQQNDFAANRQYMAPLYAIDEFEEKLKQSWLYHLDQLGAYQNLKNTKYDNFRDYEIVYLTCEFTKSDYTLKFVFNNKQQITDVYFIPYPPLIAAGDLTTLWIILFFVLWELAWKAMGLWKAGKNQQLTWFVSIFILPTFGILPIVYTLFISEKARKAQLS